MVLWQDGAADASIYRGAHEGQADRDRVSRSDDDELTRRRGQFAADQVSVLIHELRQGDAKIR